MSTKVRCSVCGRDHTTNDSIRVSASFNNSRAILNVCCDCVFLSIENASPNSFMGPVRMTSSQIRDLLDTDKHLFDKVKVDIYQQIEEMRENPIQAQTVERKVVMDGSITAEYIYGELSDYIIGQTDAKKKVSLAVERFAMSLKNPKIQKINTLLAGPTGTGKTEIARAISKTLNVPLTIVDSSSLVAAAYKGKQVLSILEDLIVAAKGDIKKAEKGIIFLDEIDKILLKTGETTGTRVQSELLKIIEGGEFSVELADRKHVRINTHNILIIAAGAFSHIAPKNQSLSLTTSYNKLKNENPKLTKSDLLRGGITPEFLGRFTYFETLESLSKSALKRILTSKKDNLVEEYKMILEEKGSAYILDDDEINSIVDEAYEQKLGARGLRIIMENRFLMNCFNTDDIEQEKEYERLLVA